MSLANASGAAHDEIWTVDGFLAAAVSGGTLPHLPRPDLLPPRALYHGVSALISVKPEVMLALPPEVGNAIRQQALAEAMWDLRHRQVLRPLIEDLAGAGVQTVVLKGTALAYSVYAAPSERPRGDTDLLVSIAMKGTAYRILNDHGFARSLDSNTDVETTAVRQEAWSLRLQDGSEHAIDLHWAVMNAWSLAHLFDTETVMQRAQPLHGLCPSARRMDMTHAFYHACLHRAVHIKSPYHVGDHSFFGGNRLIWLYDLHLIVPHLSDNDWNEVAALCKTHKTADICLDALRAMQRELGTDIRTDVLAELTASVRSGGPSSYLARNRQLRRTLADLRAIPSLEGKTLFLRKLFFPSRAYMRSKYPDMARHPVFLLYLRRFSDALRDRWWAGHP